MQGHDAVLFVSKEVKLCTEVIHHVTKSVGGQEQEGNNCLVIFQFLAPFADLEIEKREGQEFYHAERHSKRLEIVTLEEGSCLLLCPS